jgi:hypothetical protein
MFLNSTRIFFNSILCRTFVIIDEIENLIGFRKYGVMKKDC